MTGGISASNHYETPDQNEDQNEGFSSNAVCNVVFVRVRLFIESILLFIRGDIVAFQTAKGFLMREVVTHFDEPGVRCI